MPLRRLRCGRSAVCGAGCGAGSSPFEGTAACGFSRPLGGRMHCLDLLSSASPGFCRLRVQSSFGRTDALSRLPFECIAGSCRLRVQSSFGRTDALSRLPFECIARVLPPAGSVVLWADGCIVSASFRVHRRVLPPAGSVVLRADGCIVSTSFRVHRPGSAACGNRSLVRGDGINRRDGPMHPEGGEAAKRRTVPKTSSGTPCPVR